jgi:hypothetical protein
MRSDPHHAFDALIDEAAQALTASEPPSSLRQAVRDRVGRRSAPWPMIPTVAGASALALAALIVGRALLGTPDSATVGRALSGTPNSSLPGAPDSATVGRALSGTPDTGAAQRGRVSHRAALAVAFEEENEPLIPPIAIEPLAPAQIAVDMSVAVAPIEIEPLQIEPLGGQ